MSRATIDTLSKRINSNKNEISVLKQKSKKRTPRDSLYCGTFAIKIYKPRIEPCLDSKVILTEFLHSVYKLKGVFTISRQ